MTAVPSDLVVVSSSDSATSKTRALADAAIDLGGGGHLVDLVELPADALLGRRQDRAVDDAVGAASAAAVLVLATPVYRATFNGSLKAFLDRFPTDALLQTAVVLAATAGFAGPLPVPGHRGRAVVASLGGWTVPTVVYATGADFDDGRPVPSLLENLSLALGQARSLATVLRA